MELFMAIALLCQTSAGGDRTSGKSIDHILSIKQLDCQQYYTHCMNTRTGSEQEGMTKCIMERKI
jgi:hypothetical protein